MSAATQAKSSSRKENKERKEKKDKGKRKADHDQDPSSSSHGGISPDILPPDPVVLSGVLDDFDYDTLENDDDSELYIIRAPSDIKPKYFDKLEISLPPPSISSLQVGSLTRKELSFDIWSVREGAEIDTAAGGEELFGLTCLLPRKKDGKLKQTSKPITRHLVVSTHPEKPEAPQPEVAGNLYKSEPRYRHPQHLLKHRFLPTGALPPTVHATSTDSVQMEVDTTSSNPTQELNAKSKPVIGSPKKKRKAEETPKKSKKSKEST